MCMRGVRISTLETDVRGKAIMPSAPHVCLIYAGRNSEQAGARTPHLAQYLGLTRRDREQRIADYPSRYKNPYGRRARS